MTQCPPPPPDQSEPSPANLAYSLTLPSATATPAVARATAMLVPDAHRLGELAAPVLTLVDELASCACWFTSAGESIYLSLRSRDDALRLIVYDGHPRHSHPRLAAACDERRRSHLRGVPRVVKACQGEWGFEGASEPARGTRSWALVPLAAARLP
ncbi:ATP-binding protein [Streptomyces sp. GC420]|nr:ATP-binding protein [Streptomyces sp. GC420]